MIKVFGAPAPKCCGLGPLGLLGCQSPLSSVLMPLLGELGLLLVDVVLVEVELLTVVGCLGGGEKTDFELGGGGAKVERAGM